MNTKEDLNKIIEIKIDRPLGSTHPKHKFYYPLIHASFNHIINLYHFYYNNSSVLLIKMLQKNFKIIDF